jgi:hypothetical protein
LQHVHDKFPAEEKKSTLKHNLLRWSEIIIEF